jgi:hypothetical protein
LLVLNIEEGWVQDVSELIARKVRRAFIDAHTERADQQVLPLWRGPLTGRAADLRQATCST